MSADALAQVHHSIAAAAARAGRKAEEVALIAISKTHDANAIRPLIAAGQRVFGENRVQEAAAKWPELKAETTGISLHLVGQLQSNKAEEAVALFDCIHSVDRSSLIAALAKAEAKAGLCRAYFPKLPICWPRRGPLASMSLASWPYPPPTPRQRPISPCCPKWRRS